MSKTLWISVQIMHPESNPDFQRSTWPSGPSGTDKNRPLTNCETRWKRTKILVTILETMLWISAIAAWFGVTHLYR